MSLYLVHFKIQKSFFMMMWALLGSTLAPTAIGIVRDNPAIHDTPPPSPEPPDYHQLRPRKAFMNHHRESYHYSASQPRQASSFLHDGFSSRAAGSRFSDAAATFQDFPDLNRMQRMNTYHSHAAGRKAQPPFHDHDVNVISNGSLPPSSVPPLRTFTLSRDPTLIVGASSLPSDAFGLRIVHGEIPGSFGRYGCVISHIFAGSFIVASDIHEGDEVIEINGIPMSEKSDEEIQLIVETIREEMDLTTRSYSTRNHVPTMEENQYFHAVNSAAEKPTKVGFGPVNQWCFNEESWPGPRTGDVSAKKAFEDDKLLLSKKGHRTTLAPYCTMNNPNASSNAKSGTIQTPWGRINRAQKPQMQPQLGMVELQMSFDYNANILYVTIIQAKNLRTFSGNIAKPDAFIVGYLLPQRTMNSMRKTCYVMESSSPFWNQTFVYPNLLLGQLRSRYLEISAWSYNYHAPNEFLGEFTLDLSDPSLLDEKNRWYQLLEGQPTKPTLVNGPLISTHRLSNMHRS